MTPTYAWTVYATGVAALLALLGMLARTLFSQSTRLDRLTERVADVGARLGELTGEMRAGFTTLTARLDRVDGRLDRVDEHLDRVDGRLNDAEATRRADKVEILDRLDVLAERITRLEQRP